MLPSFLDAMLMLTKTSPKLFRYDNITLHIVQEKSKGKDGKSGKKEANRKTD